MMHRMLATFIRVSAAVLAFTPVCGARADEAPYVPNQALVRLDPNASLPEYLARYGTTVVDSIPARHIHILTLPAAFEDEEAFVDALENDPDTVEAELNYLVNDVNPDPDTRSIFYRTNAQAYADEPAMRVIGAPTTIKGQGKGVVIAVIDSGVDAGHSLLAGRIAPGGYNFIDNNTDTSDVGDGIDNNQNTQIDEMVGHGTLVAGLAARVAPRATILPLRVLDSDGGATTFRVVKAMYHALDTGASVVNISLGTQADPDLISDAVAECEARNVLVVASAGNQGVDSPVPSPAGLSGLGVIAVAATDNADVKAAFSNFGSWVAVSAPGVLVVSLVPGDGFGAASGTSFSAPMVSGAAALLRGASPGASNADIRARLISRTAPIDQRNPGFEGKLGAGRLDLRASGAMLGGQRR